MSVCAGWLVGTWWNPKDVSASLQRGAVRGAAEHRHHVDPEEGKMSPQRAPDDVNLVTYNTMRLPHPGHVWTLHEELLREVHRPHTHQNTEGSSARQWSCCDNYSSVWNYYFKTCVFSSSAGDSHQPGQRGKHIHHS